MNTSLEGGHYRQTDDGYDATNCKEVESSDDNKDLGIGLLSSPTVTSNLLLGKCQ